MMEFLYLLIIPVLLYAIYSGKKKEEMLAKHAEEILEKVSRLFKLKYTSSRYKRPRAKGLIEGFQVKITFHYIHEAESLYEIYIKHKIHRRGQIKITSGNFNQSSSIGEKNLLTGDEDFDKKVYISSTKPHLINAFMNHSIRKRIILIPEKNVYMEISNSWFKVNIPEINVINNYPLIAASIKNMIAISKDLCSKKSIKDRLLENIEADPVDMVRYRNLITLTNLFRSDNKIKSVIKKALSDNSLLVQLAAADCLEVEGLPHLEKILNVKSLHQKHKIPLK
jgi:hypothetical protein